MIAVLGGGPVGSIAALSLSKVLGAVGRVLFCSGRRLPADDGRAAAIVGKSTAILEGLGVGSALGSAGSPLAGVRIIDISGRLVRTPDMVFQANELGQESFGYSVTNRAIVTVLQDALSRCANVTMVGEDVEAMTRTDQGFTLTMDSGAVHRVGFLVGADGQKSAVRGLGEISVRTWSYDQTALTFLLGHRRDHHDISTELHTAEGPFTFVPSGPNRSTVVWMMRPERAKARMAMDATTFAREAERESRAVLGRLTLEGDRGAYPMRGLLAGRFSAPGIALVGEAGHAFPPIGAQGLNLGIRDAATLGEAMGKAVKAGRELGEPQLLAEWERGRQRDTGLRTATVDLFNRSLLSAFPPVAAMRGLGLHALNALPPLRRAVMRAGMGQ